MRTQISRRSLLGGLLGGTAAMALGPRAVAALVGPAPGIIRLSYNENPYGPGPAALKAAADASANGAYYAGRITGELIRTIADRQGLSTENVAVSTGSNEALCAATTAWAKRGRVLVPALTYDPHLEYAREHGAELVEIPLAADLSIDLAAMARAVDNSVSMVYVCNPNNPTGLTLDGDELRAFCRDVGRQATVVVDEAYNELTEDPEYTSMVDLVRAGENVIVMRTFSKIFGMAGMRVGYALARPDLVARVRSYVMSWPNIVGLAAANAAYTDDEFIRYSREMITKGRGIVNAAFRRNGIEPLASQTNFVYADIGIDADAFAAAMRERNILIRGAYPPYDNHVRVSMGRLEELEVFADAFDELYPAARSRAAA